MEFQTSISTLLGERPIRRLAPYIYAVLIVGLFLHPHFSAHIGPELRPYVEGITNALIVGLGIATYYIYRREQREFGQRFLETSTYIGTMNRKLSLLQNITTDLLSESATTAKQKTKIFQELLGIACGTIAKSDRGLLRFIEIDTGRTVKEFQYSLANERPDPSLTIGNKELLRCDSLQQTAHAGHTHLIIAASDRAAAIRAFLVIPAVRKEIFENTSMLQAIADQGQILSGYLFGDLSKNYA